MATQITPIVPTPANIEQMEEFIRQNAYVSSIDNVARPSQPRLKSFCPDLEQITEYTKNLEEYQHDLSVYTSAEKRRTSENRQLEIEFYNHARFVLGLKKITDAKYDQLCALARDKSTGSYEDILREMDSLADLLRD